MQIQIVFFISEVQVCTSNFFGNSFNTVSLIWLSPKFLVLKSVPVFLKLVRPGYHRVCCIRSGDVVLLAVDECLEVRVRELGELVGPTCVLRLELLGPVGISFWKRNSWLQNCSGVKNKV